MDDDVFMIRARRCLRCGRLLTSEEAVEAGYRCRCKELANAEAAALEPLPGQMNILDFLKEE